MKNILAVLDSKVAYGKELSNIEVYKTLKKYGYDITVLYNVNASEKLKVELCDFKRIPICYPRNIVGKWRKLKYVIATIKSNCKVGKILLELTPDVLLMSTEIAFLYLLPVFLLNKNIKVIFRMGDAPISYRKKERGLMVKLYRYIWEHVIVYRIDCVVSISNFIKEKLHKYGRKSNPLDVVIYNFPPMRHFLDVENIQIKKTNNVIFGYLGRIVEDKGVILLVEAALEILDEGCCIDLYLAGDTSASPAYFKKIKSRLNASSQAEHIHFLEEISNIEDFYKSIDVACTPSIYEEPLGNVLVEAKAFGKPSIIFNRGGMPEIIEHRRNGYICEEITVKSLKNALLYYINNPQRCILEGQDAKESIKRLGIDRKTYERKWIEVMDKIL